MASFSDKIPPPFDKRQDDYVKWKRKLKLWQEITDVPKEKCGMHVLLRLDDDTQEAVQDKLELTDIKTAEGTDKILTVLDTLFKVDESVKAYEIYDDFECYHRPPTLSIPEYCTEFENKLNKVKKSGTTLSEHVIAYRMLKSANLSEVDERMVRATIDKMTSEAMSKQLKKTFSSSRSSEKQKSGSEVSIKQEPLDSVENDTLYGSYSHYNRNTDRRDHKGYGGGYHYQRDRNRDWSEKNINTQLKDQKGFQDEQKLATKRRGKNPLDPNGNVTRCWECDSINHWRRKCPDLVDKVDTYYASDSHQYLEEMYQNENQSVIDIHLAAVTPHKYDDLTKITFSLDTLNTAVLDSGAPKSVCGDTWLNQYVGALSEEDQLKVQHSKSKNIYKFGCGSKLTASGHVVIPALIGERKVMIHSDVISGDLPLLFGREAMKQTDSSLDFKDDTLQILGQKINLKVTKSGHYALPLSRNQQNIIKAERNPNIRITLAISKDLTTKQVAVKLHRQFSHPNPETLVRLVRNQGKECEDLVAAIQEVSNNCSFCAKYKKSLSRPMVGFHLASRFNQCISMDLQQFGDVYLLHMVDHATRLISGSVIRSRNPAVIVRKIWKHWFSIYGVPENILSNNGGEFSNPELREVCEKHNIVINTTTAESPWANALMERHHDVISNMLLNIQEDTGCTLEMAITWAISAHNCLSNIHGYSPCQLVFGRNPVLPVLQSSKPPALNDEITSDIIRQNLSALHASRQAFIKTESDERIRRILQDNIGTSGDTKYITGDKVFYKCMDSRRWKGPGTVIGQDEEQVLVKHGGIYVKRHPSRLSLEKQTIVGLRDNNTTNKDSEFENKSMAIAKGNVVKTRSVIYKDSAEESCEDLQVVRQDLDHGESSAEGISIEDNVQPENVTPASDVEVTSEEVNAALPEYIPVPPNIEKILKEAELSDTEVTSKEVHVQPENKSPDPDIEKITKEAELSADSDGASVEIVNEISDKQPILVDVDSSEDVTVSEPSDDESSEGAENIVAEPNGDPLTHDDEDSNEGSGVLEKKKRGRPPKNTNKVIRSNSFFTLKPGSNVKFKKDGDDDWRFAKLDSRAGKKGGRHGNCWNIVNTANENEVIDLDNDVKEWQVMYEKKKIVLP